MTDTLDVIDSYLSLDDTQYAQAPIGNTRLATFGNGTSLYGTIPTWTATNWEIEFDVQFPKTISSAIRRLIDSPNGVNRQGLYTVNSSGQIVAIQSNGTPVIQLDGVTIVSGATPHPVDGAVHHIKLTGSYLIAIGKVLSNYITTSYSESAIFNLRLTDLSNSANSRFYPMDETIETSTFLDTSANAQHGTWFNRVAGYVVTVYPDGIKVANSFWLAFKVKFPAVPTSKILAALGAYVSSYSSFVIGVNGSDKLYAARVNGTTATNTATLSGVTLAANTEYVVVAKCHSDNTIALYVNSIDAVATASAGSAFAAGINFANLNGARNSSSNATATLTTAESIYWAYIYNTISPADITALMQGEHPASVGNIRQGYNLSGNGDEVNGGPALTLYNAPSFVVPKRIGLTRPLISSLVSTLTSSLVSN